MRKRLCLSSVLLWEFVIAEPVVISEDEDKEVEVAKLSEEELLQRVFGTRRQQKNVVMEFNVTLDGEDAGQAFAMAGKEKKIFAKRLKEILATYLHVDEIARIDKLVDNEGFVSFEKLSFLNLQADFNLQTLAIEIKVPLNKKKTRNLSGRKHEKEKGPELTVTPANVSAILGTRVSHSISQNKDSPNSKRTDLILAPSLNIKGIVLEGEGTFQKSSETDKFKFHRDYSSLVYDFPRDEITIYAGDVFGISQSYYSVPRLWGIGFRKKAPSSSVSNCNQNMRITVLRESKIEIFVNGTLLRTQEHVAPGTYYLDDVPYSYGSNDVKIKLTDETGKTEIIDAGGFLDSSVIAPGTFSLDCCAGYPESNGKDGRYDKKNTTVSLGIRYGLPNATDILIGGVRSKSGHTGTLELRNSNKFGFFNVQYGVSKYEKKLSGTAWSFSYSSPSVDIYETTSISFGAAYEKTDDFFYAYLSPANSLDKNQGQTDEKPNREQTNSFPPNDSILLNQRQNQNGKNTRTSCHLYVSDLFGISFSLGYEIDRHQYFHNERRYSFSLSKHIPFESGIFNSMSLYFSHNRTSHSDNKSSKNYSISCSFSLKNGDMVSSGHSKYDDRSSEYISYSGSCLDNSLYYSVQGDYQSEDNAISGRLTYYHQRFKTDLYHNRNNHSSTSTQIGAETNLYFADGSFGMSQNSTYDGGFVIVKPSGELKNHPIRIVGSKAESGILGGAIITSSHHSICANEVDVSKMPNNIEIKDGSIVTYGEYKRGAVKEISVDGIYLASGILLDRHGKPFEMAAGFATYIGNKNIEPVTFFTNAGGKFVLSNLKLGKYRVSVNVEGCEDFYIDIKPCKNNIVDLGAITCEGTYEDI